MTKVAVVGKTEKIEENGFSFTLFIGKSPELMLKLPNSLELCRKSSRRATEEARISSKIRLITED